MGEESVQAMSQLEKTGTWNFENKMNLLEAELHYLDQRHAMAEISYQLAIASAHDHRVFHEEALAQELYGFYLIENGKSDRGLDQMRQAVDKYNQWGALKKARHLSDNIEAISALPEGNK